MRRKKNRPMPGDPRVRDGNSRINAMQRRTTNPDRKFTDETEIPVEVLDN